MRRAKTKISIQINTTGIDDGSTRSASFSAHTEEEIDREEGDEKKMFSEKQQRKVAKKLSSINRYFFRSKLISPSHSGAVPIPPSLKLITAPPPTDDNIAGSEISTDNDSNSGKVLHYAASLGTLRSDLAKARVLLDENRARETREATAQKAVMPSVPGWAALLLDYGHEYRLHNNNDNSNNHKQKQSEKLHKKSQKRQNNNKHKSRAHLLHLTVPYCGCLKCLVDDVDARSDDVPDSLGELDDIGTGGMDDMGDIPDNKDVGGYIGDQDNAAAAVDDAFHDESLGVFSHEIRRISTTEPEEEVKNNNSALATINSAVMDGIDTGGMKVGSCSMGSKCVILQGKECIFEKTDQLTLHQTPPRNAVTQPVPSEAALRALCDTGDTGIPLRTEMEMGIFRKGAASFSGQIAGLNSTCCSVRPEEILRAVETLYSSSNSSSNTKKGRTPSGKFVLQGALYRFGLDAGVFPVDSAAQREKPENTNGNTHDGNSDGRKNAIAVVHRRQPFVILSGIIAIPGKSMGEYIPSDLEVTLGFGEDNSGARDVYPDGSLGPPRNLCLNELLVHVPMHLRDDRWELILK